MSEVGCGDLQLWSDLSEALKTGAPQTETKHSGEPMFAKLSLQHLSRQARAAVVGLTEDQAVVPATGESSSITQSLQLLRELACLFEFL